MHVRPISQLSQPPPSSLRFFLPSTPCRRSFSHTHQRPCDVAAEEDSEAGEGGRGDGRQVRSQQMEMWSEGNLKEGNAVASTSCSAGGGTY
eukprot:746152-Hanusia_phi.AAC.1